MLRGVIHNNQPLIKLVIAWNLGVQEIVALVDTGFTGELKIPPSKVSELSLQITHTEPICLANEKIVNMQASIAAVSMEGVAKVVNVLISDGMPIIGVGLLKRFGYILKANFKRDFLILEK